MVVCPKCKNKMQYVKTDADLRYSEEAIVVIDASVHYHCASCTSDVTLNYVKEVKLE